jgi:hypothetical protein
LFFFLVISYSTIREHFSREPIDFEEKPIKIESLNERDIIVNKNIFLLKLFFSYSFYSDLSSFMCTTKCTFIWRRFNITSIFTLFFISFMYTKSEILVANSNWTNVKINSREINYFIFQDLFFRPWSEFIDHLATIRLDEERINQYPPNIIILQTAKILFKAVN